MVVVVVVATAAAVAAVVMEVAVVAVAVAAVIVAAVMVVVEWVWISQRRAALVKPTMIPTWGCEWEATECCEAASKWSSTRKVPRYI
jgi:hypothetical protein